MHIDRVAKSMTQGAPRRGFTARVMAPIEGRPSPDFTRRVMARIDEPRVAQVVRPAVQPALGLAAVLLALGGFVLTQGTARIPAAPGAPRLATNAGPRVPETPALSPSPPMAPDSPMRRAPRADLAAHVAGPEPEPEPVPVPIYRIAALDAPDGIALRSIEPAACTVPALDGPAPLKVSDLPGSAGGSRQEFKEKP